jgi:hypothetical protein
MAGIVRMLGPSTDANGVVNATTLDSAHTVYVSNKTGNAIVTVVSNQYGTTSLHMHADHDVIIEKGKADTIYSNSANTHFTKVAYTRG